MRIIRYAIAITFALTCWLASVASAELTENQYDVAWALGEKLAAAEFEAHGDQYDPSKSLYAQINLDQLNAAMLKKCAPEAVEFNVEANDIPSFRDIVVTAYMNKLGQLVNLQGK